MKCECCNKELVGRYQKRFCSHECSAKTTNRQRAKIRHCLNCNNQLKIGSNQKKFCSKSCQTDHYRKLMIKKLENGNYTQSFSGDKFLRRYLIEKRGRLCECCKNTTWLNKEIPLTVHHIDGNASNNLPINLQLLCWNCHALTDNYGKKNLQSSRVYRYKE